MTNVALGDHVMYHMMCHVTCQVTDHMMKHVTVHMTLSAHDLEAENIIGCHDITPLSRRLLFSDVEN